MKMDQVASSHNDEFYTPEYAISPIIKYLNKNSTVWCPFDTEESHFVKMLKTEGHNVIYTHIGEGQDFFETEPPKCDYIISNPPYSCLTPDHEVLTKDGWKPIYEIKENDYVLTTDLNQNISWQRNKHLITKDIKENIYCFKSKYIDIQATKNHRMLAYRGDNVVCLNKSIKDLVVADEIKAHWYQPRTEWKWNGETKEYFTLPGVYVSNGHTEVYHAPIDIPMLNWVRFLGLWLADGSVKHTKNIYNKPRFSVSIKQHNKTADKVFEIVSRLPFNVKVYENNNQKNIEIHSKQLWEYLYQFGKSKDKFIPEYIKNGDKNILTAFIEGYAFSDSYETKYKESKSIVFSTVSKRLADDVQEVLLKLGRMIPVTLSYSNNKPLYSLVVSKNSKFSGKMNYNTPEVKPYEGKVYCLQLETNSIFLTRRNGKICFTGNCKTEVLQRLFSLDIPFAMLVGVVGLFESQKRFDMFKSNKFEIIYFNRRISYFKNYDDQNPSLHPPFSSVYVCHNILPQQIIFEEIKICNKNKKNKLQAMDILPDGDKIHTFDNPGFGLMAGYGGGGVND